MAPSYCNTPKVTVVNQLIEVQSASTSDHRQWCVGSGDEQWGRSIVARRVQVHRRPVYVSRTHSLSPPGARGRILTQLLGRLPPFACAISPPSPQTGARVTTDLPQALKRLGPRRGPCPVRVLVPLPVAFRRARRPALSRRSACPCLSPLLHPIPACVVHHLRRLADLSACCRCP